MYHGIQNCRRVGKFTVNTFHKTSWQNINAIYGGHFGWYYQNYTFQKSILHVFVLCVILNVAENADLFHLLDILPVLDAILDAMIEFK